MLRAKYFQLIADNIMPYQYFSITFYRSFLLPLYLISSDKAQGIDSKRLWLDVYKIQNHRIPAVFHYLIEYWLGYNFP